MALHSPPFQVSRTYRAKRWIPRPYLAMVFFLTLVNGAFVTSHVVLFRKCLAANGAAMEQLGQSVRQGRYDSRRRRSFDDPVRWVLNESNFFRFVDRLRRIRIGSVGYGGKSEAVRTHLRAVDGQNLSANESKLRGNSDFWIFVITRTKQFSN